MTDYTPFHNANILIHVAAGSIALLLGLFTLLTQKGGKLHAQSGKVFLYLLVVVILTGLVGVFIYQRNTFLLVITVLSGYFGFSGYRTLQTKSNKVQRIDVLATIVALLVVVFFLYYFQSQEMYWSPIIIYSTIGTLIAIIAYDLLRYLIPNKKYQNLWLYEHIFKMIGAFSALLSAFSGTVLYEYQPYSQFMPSVLGTLLQIGFIIYYVNNNKLKSRKK